MGCTEGALTDKAGVAAQLASHTMNLRGLQTLGQRQGRQDARQPLGQHRLTASRRAYHDNNLNFIFQFRFFLLYLHRNSIIPIIETVKYNKNC